MEFTEDRIKVGDKVTVSWETLKTEFAVEVLYMPQATGDCWHLKREDGTIVYVNSFCSMIKLNKEE